MLWWCQFVALKLPLSHLNTRRKWVFCNCNLQLVLEWHGMFATRWLFGDHNCCGQVAIVAKGQLGDNLETTIVVDKLQ